MRVLVNSSTVVKSPTFAGSDGEAANLTSGVPTVVVTRDDGTVLTPPTAVTAGVVGVYQVTLTNAAHTTQLDWLTLTWTGTTSAGPQTIYQSVEVAGGVFVTVAALRASTDGALADSSKFTADVLNQTVEEFEHLAENYCGDAMVPRFQRDNLVGDGRTSLHLTRTLVRSSSAPLYLLSAAAVDTSGVTTPFTATNWVPSRAGVLTAGSDVSTDALGEPSIIVRYTHGLDRPPAGIVKACKLWVRNQLLQDRNSFGRDVLSENQGPGISTSYSTPDWDAGRPTGLFDVDRELNAYGRRAPQVA